MNATRPEAETEYSTASPARSGSGRGFWAASALTLAGAVVLLVAELVPVLRVETIAARPILVSSIQTGPHDGWALVPIAVLALLLALLARRARSRVAFAGVGVLGLAALAIALLIDRSDVHATGAVVLAHVLRPATIRAGVGLYLETLAGAMLAVAGAVGQLP